MAVQLILLQFMFLFGVTKNMNLYYFTDAYACMQFVRIVDVKFKHYLTFSMRNQNRILTFSDTIKYEK